MSDLKHLLEQDLKGSKIAVVGDLILDEHVFCDVLGISPEDDLAPKLKMRESKFALGGAANVAHNLKALGVGEVFLYGRYSDNDNNRNQIFKDACKGAGVQARLISEDKCPMSLKIRYLMPRGRHVCRIDDEVTTPASEDVSDLIGLKIKRDGPFDVIVVSDYNKGVVTPATMGTLYEINGKAKVVVDPKGAGWGKYGAPYAMTPNRREAFQSRFLVPVDTEDWVAPANAKFTVITAGAAGCTIFTRGEGYKIDQQGDVLETRLREVGDPTGCGDSFVAGLAFATLLGSDIKEASRFASACGACAYDHTGVKAVTSEEVGEELDRFEY